MDKIMDKNAETYYNMDKVFYPAISSCDELVYVQRFSTGKITAGVRAEIKYAESIGKKVYSSEHFYGTEMLEEELYHEQHG